MSIARWWRSSGITQWWRSSRLTQWWRSSASDADASAGAQPEDETGWPARAWPYARKGLIVLGCAFGALCILSAGYVVYVLPSVPSKADLLEVRIAEPSTLMSADGKPLATFRRVTQERIGLAQVSPYALQALIATEDRRFFQHRGIDLRRTLAAVGNTLTGDVQGGSTITQQLARNLFPEEIGRDRTINRKIKELITALRIERVYTKQQILETYLNTVPFLYNVFGIEMAARTYYDKSAADLDALESATLIGMLKGTRIYNPVVNPERAFERRNIVLASMVAHKQLSEADYRALRVRPLQVRFNRQPLIAGPAPHFAEHVRKWLIDWADRNDYDIHADGLVVHTTIDSAMQNAAVAAVERQAEMLQAVADVEWGHSTERVAATVPSAYEKLRGKVPPFEHFWRTRGDLVEAFVRETPEYAKAVQAGEAEGAVLARLRSDAAFMARLRAGKTRLEAGFMAIDPSTGEIRAWVGSRDFKVDQFDHAAQAERQPGSTFKPFVYGAALERGIPPEHTYLDQPVQLRISNNKVWKPTDMSGSSGEMMTMREGLVRSKNTITAQVMIDVGVPAIVRLARSMGVDHSKLDPVPSLALGTSPVTLLEMVSAYSTIARKGEYNKPIFIKRVVDRTGKVLVESQPQTHRALSERSAIDLIDMLRDAVSRGTGQAVKTTYGISADVGGKTGTTQNNTDGWFILMHPGLVAGAWVGFNDARVAMRSSYWGQGGHNAIHVVGDFFRSVLQAGLVDAKAQFPRPPRPVVVAVSPPEIPADGSRIRPEDERIDSTGAPRSLVVRRDAEGVHITDAPGSYASPRWREERGSGARTAEELTRIMSGMGRDPVTGAPLGSAPAAASSTAVRNAPGGPAGSSAVETNTLVGTPGIVSVPPIRSPASSASAGGGPTLHTPATPASNPAAIGAPAVSSAPASPPARSGESAAHSGDSGAERD